LLLLLLLLLPLASIFFFWHTVTGSKALLQVRSTSTCSWRCNGYRACHWTQGSKPNKGDGFLKAIKIRSMTSFGEVKPSASCRKFYDRLNIPWGKSEILIGKIQRQFLAYFVPASLLGVTVATKAENSGG
jgi:hypothetical protein